MAKISKNVMENFFVPEEKWAEIFIVFGLIFHTLIALLLPVLSLIMYLIVFVFCFCNEIKYNNGKTTSILIFFLSLFVAIFWAFWVLRAPFYLLDSYIFEKEILGQ